MEQILFRGHTGEHPVEVSDQDNLRSLRFGTDERQSCMDLKRPHHLELAYTRWMMAGLLLHPNPCNFLVMGLGGGSIPKFLGHHHPDACIDVVEKEQLVIQCAQTYFNLQHSEKITLYHQDAVDFLAKSEPTRPYHLAFIDIFGSGTMALPLYVVDFYRSLFDRLSGDGILIINLWSGNKELFQTAHQAVREACEDRVLQMQVKKRSNVILMAFPQSVPHKQLKTAKKNLPSFTRRYQLEFPQYLKRLRRTNRPFLASLLQRKGV